MTSLPHQHSRYRPWYPAADIILLASTRVGSMNTIIRSYMHVSRAAPAAPSAAPPPPHPPYRNQNRKQRFPARNSSRTDTAYVARTGWEYHGSRGSVRSVPPPCFTSRPREPPFPRPLPPPPPPPPHIPRHTHTHAHAHALTPTTPTPTTPTSLAAPRTAPPRNRPRCSPS